MKVQQKKNLYCVEILVHNMRNRIREAGCVASIHVEIF
jgi:hypothetical protein